MGIVSHTVLFPGMIFHCLLLKNQKIMLYVQTNQCLTRLSVKSNMNPILMNIMKNIILVKTNIIPTIIYTTIQTPLSLRYEKRKNVFWRKLELILNCIVPKNGIVNYRSSIVIHQCQIVFPEHKLQV